ncbi:MAG: ribose-phosphate pyrophosphokinase, partial [Ruminococcaceae bacterium]|nr:ribose-phosphate pyrophosphokinase [Oscillospiraceae bacterium]
MPDYTEEFTTIPYGPLGIIALPGCEDLAEKIDKYIVKWRAQKQSEHKHSIAFAGYERDSYLINVSFPRFGTGEGKGTICQSVRGYDLFIVCDVFNYGINHNIYGIDVPMTPDEHFANLKRAIAAVAGKAHRITVIMPMLYEGRQHKRTSRESLDCALALQELCNMMGV